MGNCASNDEDKDYLKETLANHENAINKMALSPDKSVLVTASEDGTAMLWNMLGGNNTECLGMLSGHTEYISSVAVTGTFIITGSADCTIRKWDIFTLECVFVYEGHDARILNLMVVGDQIVSCSYDSTIRVWHVDTSHIAEGNEESACLGVFKGHGKAVYSMIFIPQADSDVDSGAFDIQDLLITGSADLTARIWSFEERNCLTILKGHVGAVTKMTVDAEGKVLITAGADCTIRTWNISTGQSLRVMLGHRNTILCMVMSRRFLYTGSADTWVKCWLSEFGDCTRTYRGHNHAVICMIMEYGTLFTGCGDGHIRAYSPTTGHLKRTYKGHEAPVNCLVIVQNKMYSGSSDYTIRHWDVGDVREEALFNDDEEPDIDLEKSLTNKNILERPGSTIRHLIKFPEAKSAEKLRLLQGDIGHNIDSNILEKVVEVFSGKIEANDDELTVEQFIAEAVELMASLMRNNCTTIVNRICNIIGMIAMYANPLPKLMPQKINANRNVVNIHHADESCPDWCANCYFPSNATELQHLVKYARKEGKSIALGKQHWNPDLHLLVSLVPFEQNDPLFQVRGGKYLTDKDTNDLINFEVEHEASDKDGHTLGSIKVGCGVTSNVIEEWSRITDWLVPLNLAQDLRSGESLAQFLSRMTSRHHKAWEDIIEEIGVLDVAGEEKRMKSLEMWLEKREEGGFIPFYIVLRLTKDSSFIWYEVTDDQQETSEDDLVTWSLQFTDGNEKKVKIMTCWDEEVNNYFNDDEIFETDSDHRMKLEGLKNIIVRGLSSIKSLAEHNSSPKNVISGKSQEMMEELMKFIEREAFPSDEKCLASYKDVFTLHQILNCVSEPRLATLTAKDEDLTVQNYCKLLTGWGFAAKQICFKNETRSIEALGNCFIDDDEISEFQKELGRLADASGSSQVLELENNELEQQVTSNNSTVADFLQSSAEFASA